jgi:MarR-like DNA-binding transcriptional regulator SgrR of sgrS sRNA
MLPKVLLRRGAQVNRSQVLWKVVKAVEARVPYVVVLKLKQPSASLVYGLAEPAAMIYPRREPR